VGNSLGLHPAAGGTQTGSANLAALGAADMVVALSAYRTQAIDYADVLLPIAPFTETAGTFVSTEGRGTTVFLFGPN